MEKVDINAPRNGRSDADSGEIAKAVAVEVARLRSAGYGKDYICERSFEIEERIRQQLGR